ncbi:hypothetical protein HPB48_012745 [Haemaphysalis longicornis]|uniref:Uncharacterized protein n=1 Tax=Haemaphysalis longicornis TaxID=44386 RepID=A0A9J6GEG7_HAELO|nr:hypothetical protein HPB48_012745 [Haemaphysalis longicornis]
MPPPGAASIRYGIHGAWSDGRDPVRRVAMSHARPSVSTGGHHPGGRSVSMRRGGCCHGLRGVAIVLGSKIGT